MGGLNAAIPLLGNTGAATGGGVAANEAVITETLGLTPGLLTLTRRGATAADTLGLSPSVIAYYGQVLVENLRFTLTQTPTFIYQKSLSDALQLSSALIPGVAQTITETLGLHDDPQVQRAIAVIETLGLQSSLTPTFIYLKTVNDTIRFTDSFLNFFGADVVDGLGFSDEVTRTAMFDGPLTETIALSETWTPRFVLRVTVTDDLELSDTQALQMLFSQEVVENLEFSIAYLSPGGSFATWAVNTRSGAVTEYNNYAFNSFAQLGDRYYGASDAGLYELLGDNDDGTNIVATIKSGFAQWAGSKFTMFKGVYLGVHGSGAFVLKLITGDNKTYTYTVNAQSQKTTKIVTGKGLRARYWAFELTSSGQDFDLDTIEFVPIVADRRV